MLLFLGGITSYAQCSNCSDPSNVISEISDNVFEATSAQAYFWEICEGNATIQGSNTSQTVNVSCSSGTFKIKVTRFINGNCIEACETYTCGGGNSCDDYWVAILDEYIDGTQSGSDYVYLMANGNYPSGATYTWTTTRQSGLTQTYATTTDNPRLVDASINNRITSASVTVSYQGCSETVNRTFACAIPNSDANGDLFPECNRKGGGGLSKKEKTAGPCEEGSVYMDLIKINCPSKRFIVSGYYIIPSCDATYEANVTLYLDSFNSLTGEYVSSEVIAQRDFTNPNYSFTINPLSLNLDPTLEYDLVVIANFSDNTGAAFGHQGKEITFIDCEEEDECESSWVAILDEYIDGTQSGSDNVYLMANGNYPSGATYNWTTTRQSGLTQSYSGGDTILVSASINDRIVSATVTVSYEECTETVSKTFACAIPNTDANGNTFPECNGNGGGFGKKAESIKVSPNPVKAGSSIKIQGLESYDVNAIEVVDMFGNIKFTQKTKADSIRLGNLNTGIYFIKISTKQGIIQKKIIVK
ncbi:T9SS type A sorting domain-containing protein [Winogradskyella sp. MIT101101]|uniref:T9SS type A sorting domain-containing protein n=1 Tax=Winogradskyella sp. MIT101101 TaxID=3098297 RepID=UPI00399987D4